MKSPHKGQQAGRNAESDHVGQRIELAAKIGHRVGHARDAPVKRIKRDGKENGDRGPVKVHLGIVVRDGVDGLRDGEVAGADVARRK